MSALSGWTLFWLQEPLPLEITAAQGGGIGYRHRVFQLLKRQHRLTIDQFGCEQLSMEQLWAVDQPPAQGLHKLTMTK